MCVSVGVCEGGPSILSLARCPYKKQFHVKRENLFSSCRLEAVAPNCPGADPILAPPVKSSPLGLSFLPCRATPL